MLFLSHSKALHRTICWLIVLSAYWFNFRLTKPPNHEADCPGKAVTVSRAKMTKILYPISHNIRNKKKHLTCILAETPIEIPMSIEPTRARANGSEIAASWSLPPLIALKSERLFHFYPHSCFMLACQSKEGRWKNMCGSNICGPNHSTTKSKLDFYKLSSNFICHLPIIFYMFICCVFECCAVLKI